MEYKASLDTLCKIITTGVIILLIALGQRIVRTLLVSQSDTTAILIHSGLIIFFIALILFSYLYAPQSYSLNNDEFIINRPVKNRVIKIADITEIRIVDAADLSGTIRTFGNGGLFGYYGKYYNSKLGSMTWYVTQRKNRILIKTNSGEKIIISPDDISLIDALQTKLTK